MTIAFLVGSVGSCLAASSPFGAGLPDDGGLVGASLFPRAVIALISIQEYFNRALTATVRALHHDGAATWTLLGLSFLYGVVHAAGPGHGKAVVSSYVLSTRQSLRNGLILAVASSIAQALGAIAVILLASFLLHLTSVSITLATYRLEIISDISIMLLGLWLLWMKLVRPLQVPSLLAASRMVPRRLVRNGLSASSLQFRAAEASVQPRSTMAITCEGGARVRGRRPPCECGEIHELAWTQGALDWGRAWPVLLSTASRPCTGALIVLVFSISQGLTWAGIAATLAMGVGTAITVSALAILAVSASRTALAIVGSEGRLGNRIKRVVEVGSALTITIFGGVLLIGTVFS